LTDGRVVSVLGFVDCCSAELAATKIQQIEAHICRSNSALFMQKKTKEITGKTKTGKMPHAYLQIDGKQTEPFMDVNILGIQLSDKLYWDRNIKLVYSKMSTKIYRVRQKFRSITVNRQSKVSDSKFVGKIYPRPYA